MAAADVTYTDGSLAIQEKAKLRRVLGRLDLVLFTACAIVGLDSVAQAAEAGAQAITWLVISLVLFLIPYGMLTAELGSAFPVEGGPYEWARMAFGRPAGAVTAILYWLSNPLWVGGTLSAATIASLNAFVLSKPMNTTWEIVVGLVFIWVTVAIAIIAFRIGKWGPNIGTFVKMAVVVIFTALFIAYLVKHGRPAGASTAADLKPSLDGFLTAIGIMVFLWVGFELSNGASEEMRNPQRDVPKMIVRSGVIAAVLYGLVILGIVLVIPSAQLSGVGGFVDAYSAVSGGVLHSHPLDVVFAVLVILTLVGSGAVWLEGADRTQAIAALDGAAPAWMGRFTSFGTPISVNLSSGVVASVMCVLVLLVTKGSLASFFSVMLALTISSTTLSYLFIFPALTILRRRYPGAERPYRMPGGMPGAWAAVIITELFVVVTVITLVWPGAINAMFGQSYSMESSWGVSRVFFEVVTLGSLAVMVALGLVFWLIGERNRRRGLVGISIAADATALADTALPDPEN
ncbi:MAG TPA: APC family permease [Streptosporangiaceae bacterium]|nr:APC family permease [Streptosporangiaceae bacterium]